MNKTLKSQLKTEFAGLIIVFSLHCAISKTERAPKMKSFLSILVCLLLVSACGQSIKQDLNTEPANRNIIDGQKIFSMNAKDFGPLLKLTFSGNDNYTYSCSAVHIGHGWILTANHCIAMPIARYGGMPYITVNQYARRSTIGPISGQNYKAYSPKATSKRVLSEEGVFYNLQNPDLTAIKLDAQFSNQIALNPKVIIPTEELKKEEESKLHIAGFGETYPHRKDYGVLNVALAYLWFSTDDFFQLTQLDSNNKHYAAALPGDSGGPLFTRNAKNEIVLYGIFSTYNTMVVGGKPSTDNSYTRTEKGAGAAWLKLLMERI